MEKLSNPQAGDLLVAPPSLSHSSFAGAVVLLASRNPTMGFVLNSSTGTPLSRIAPQIESHMDTEIFWGGPVNTTTIWMLHTRDWSMPNTVTISEDLAVTSNQLMFDQLSQGHWPEYWRVFAGCSIWAPGQLEGEIEQLSTRNQGWLVAHAPDAETLLANEARGLWQSGCEWAKTQAVAQWF